jgi:hypothetical protein
MRSVISLPTRSRNRLANVDAFTHELETSQPLLPLIADLRNRDKAIHNSLRSTVLRQTKGDRQYDRFCFHASVDSRRGMGAPYCRGLAVSGTVRSCN